MTRKERGATPLDKGILTPRAAHAALLQSVLLDVVKGVKSVAVGAGEDYFWLDIDASVSGDQLKLMLSHIEEQFKARAKAGVVVEKLEMTRANAIELSKYLKQTYLREEIENGENHPFIEVNRIGSWGGIANEFSQVDSFRVEEPFQLGLQISDLGKIEDSNHHLLRIYGALLGDQRTKKEWLKIPFAEKFPGHFLLGEQKGYWQPFFEHILWQEQGLLKRELLEKSIEEKLTETMGKIPYIELDDQIKPQEELLLLSQIKSFYTLDYEPSPIQGCDLLASILNRGFCRTLSARIATNEKETLSKGISFLQMMSSIHTIVPVKNFELVALASGSLLSSAKTKAEFKNSLVAVNSKDSFLRVSCAWRDQWGRRWEIARFDACKVKSHHTGFEFLCNLFFRIDWILAIQLENERE